MEPFSCGRYVEIKQSEQWLFNPNWVITGGCSITKILGDSHNPLIIKKPMNQSVPWNDRGTIITLLK
jgi:hypothetical protein